MPAEYERVIDEITGWIANGDLKPGDALPSIRLLADQLETSQATVKVALAMMRREGTITSKPGKATYVAERPDSAADREV